MNPNVSCPAGPLVGSPSLEQRWTAAGRARVATSVLFLVDGMTFGTWAALLPSFQQKFALSAGQLSRVLFGLIAGALISMPITGRLVSRWGSRSVVYPAALGFVGTLPLLALAPSSGALLVVAVLFGLWKGALDIAVNAQGVTVEDAVGRPTFSSFQGFWSLGGLSVAFLLSLGLNHGVSPTALILAMAGLLFVMALPSIGWLLPDRKSVVSRERAPSIPWRNGHLIRLGALAFLALFSEGVLLDWSAVYARTVGGVSVAAAPVAFAVFALAMSGGRFAGDALNARFGSPKVLRISGLLLMLGIAIAVGLRTWPGILAGFGIVGFGVANLVPVIFGAAGRAHDQGAGPGLATVTTLGYSGFLSGPPVIGLLAASAGLPSAFAIVILFGASLAAFGPAIVRGTRPTLQTL